MKIKTIENNSRKSIGRNFVLNYRQMDMIKGSASGRDQATNSLMTCGLKSGNCNGYYDDCISFSGTCNDFTGDCRTFD